MYEPRKVDKKLRAMIWILRIQKIAFESEKETSTWAIAFVNMLTIKTELPNSLPIYYN